MPICNLMLASSAPSAWLNLGFSLVFGGLLVLGAGLWWRGFRRLRRGQPLIESESVRVPLGFVDVVLFFLCWAIGQTLVVQMISSVGIGSGEAGEVMTVEQLTRLTWANALGQSIVTGLAAAFLIAKYRSGAAIGLHPSRWRRDLKLGGLAFLMVVPIVLTVQWALTQLVKYNHPTLELLRQSGSATTLIACWVAAVLVAPITEEIFFRGVLQGWMQRLNRTSLATDQILMGGWDVAAGNPPVRPKAWWPIIATASVFALAHLGQGPAPIPLFLLGLGLGYLYRQTGSILPCIVLHLMLNGYSMFWFTLNMFFGTSS